MTLNICQGNKITCTLVQQKWQGLVVKRLIWTELSLRNAFYKTANSVVKVVAFVWSKHLMGESATPNDCRTQKPGNCLF